MNESQIFEELGRLLLADSPGSRSLSPAENESAGRGWFESVKSVLSKHICENQVLMGQLFRDGPALRNAVTVALLDTALHSLVLPVPIAAVSHAILCYGIQSLCAEEKQ
jgi:hypothetical protein